MKIDYHEYKPSPDLKAYVECYWMHSFEGGSNEESPVQKCLPIGMYEMLFFIDENIGLIYNNGIWEPLPRNFFTGIYDKSVEWKMPGCGRLFGIRLKPETFSQLFDAPAASLYCSYVQLENFLGKEADELIHALFDKENITAIIAQTEVFLSKRLTLMEKRNNYIVAAANLIRNAKGNITIEEVSNTVAVGMRQLQRSFKENMGTSPKSYVRIIRFRNALTCLKEVPEWADITYDLGYADQAHFIREFRQFAGEAPRRVANNTYQYYKKPFEFTGA
ncbi:helix-turn-helix transcriptional regulator [Flavobacterium sp. NRK1]|uniref:helix-turn-helix transcriptional regulator n=1 Tax=Flavobacterium sp. NRK1 TaxID=2954929 RepID=UPI002093D9F2|nr:helix-turn-helix transcriptional regulator [Flavobacterium sp. NRK1]MCO6147364.1 helix-turn-helix transcriptional regulator [Flavobacterium sp. NRK1]